MIDYLKKLDVISKRYNDRINGIESRKQANRAIKSEFYKSEIKRDFLHAFNGGDLILILNSMPIGSKIIFEKNMSEGDILKIFKDKKNEYMVSCKLGKCEKQNEFMDVIKLKKFLENIHDKYFKFEEDYFKVVESLEYML